MRPILTFNFERVSYQLSAFDQQQSVKVLKSTLLAKYILEVVDCSSIETTKVSPKGIYLVTLF